MAKLDTRDILLLRQMYFSAPTMIELGISNQTKIYRLRRLDLCRCDRLGDHPGQPRCWSLSPLGTKIVELADLQDWTRQEWSIDHRVANE